MKHRYGSSIRVRVGSISSAVLQVRYRGTREDRSVFGKITLPKTEGRRNSHTHTTPDSAPEMIFSLLLATSAVTAAAELTLAAAQAVREIKFACDNAACEAASHYAEGACAEWTAPEFLGGPGKSCGAAEIIEGLLKANVAGTEFTFSDEVVDGNIYSFTSSTSGLCMPTTITFDDEGLITHEQSEISMCGGAALTSSRSHQLASHGAVGLVAFALGVIVAHQFLKRSTPMV